MIVIVAGLLGLWSLLQALRGVLALLRGGDRQWTPVEVQVMRLHEGEKTLGEGMRQRVVTVPLAECSFRTPGTGLPHVATVELDPMSIHPRRTSAGEVEAPIEPGSVLTFFVDAKDPDDVRQLRPSRGRQAGTVVWQVLLPAATGVALIWWALWLHGGAA